MIALLLGLALAGPPDDDVVAACEAALEARDPAGLQTCVEAWVLTDPRNPTTDWYAFHLALANEDTTAAVSARNRALARGIDDERARILGITPLPYNPMLTFQRVFLGVVLLLGMMVGVWARVRAIRGVDG